MSIYKFNNIVRGSKVVILIGYDNEPASVLRMLIKEDNCLKILLSDCNDISSLVRKGLPYRNNLIVGKLSDFNKCDFKDIAGSSLFISLVINRDTQSNIANAIVFSGRPNTIFTSLSESNLNMTHVPSGSVICRGRLTDSNLYYSLINYDSDLLPTLKAGQMKNQIECAERVIRNITKLTGKPGSSVSYHAVSAILKSLSLSSKIEKRMPKVRLKIDSNDFYGRVYVDEDIPYDSDMIEWFSKDLKTMSRINFNIKLKGMMSIIGQIPGINFEKTPSIKINKNDFKLTLSRLKDIAPPFIMPDFNYKRYRSGKNMFKYDGDVYIDNVIYFAKRPRVKRGQETLYLLSEIKVISILFSLINGCSYDDVLKFISDVGKRRCKEFVEYDKCNKLKVKYDTSSGYEISTDNETLRRYGLYQIYNNITNDYESIESFIDNGSIPEAMGVESLCDAMKRGVLVYSSNMSRFTLKECLENSIIFGE